ncbi:MAG: Ig-like domain-containing protein [Bacteroidota bacterium]
MSRCFAPATLVAALLAVPASAQISVTIDDFYGEIGVPQETISVSTESDENLSPADLQAIEALTLQTGAEQTWDFTVLTYTDRDTTETEAYDAATVSGLPGASEFPTATYAQGSVGGQEGSYLFFRNEGNSLFSLGGVDRNSAGEDSFLRFNPDGLQQFDFPLTFGAAPTFGTSNVESEEFPSNINATVEATSTVVGYGTLITPDGSFDALMVDTDATIRITILTIVTTVSQDRTTWITLDGARATAIFRGNGATAEANYQITAPVNQAPSVPATLTETAITGTEITVDVLASASDPDGDDLTVTAVTDPANGTATIQGGAIAYTSDASFTGGDSFDYTVSDGRDEATGTVTVTVINNTSAEGDPRVLSFAALPNPSTGQTRLLLSTAEATPARIAVYDLLGREAAVVWDGPLAAGEHSLPLDVAALSPGVYVARAELAGGAATVRLTVAR